MATKIWQKNLPKILGHRGGKNLKRVLGDREVGSVEIPTILRECKNLKFHQIDSALRQYSREFSIPRRVLWALLYTECTTMPQQQFGRTIQVPAQFILEGYIERGYSTNASKRSFSNVFQPYKNFKSESRSAIEDEKRLIEVPPHSLMNALYHYRACPVMIISGVYYGDVFASAGATTDIGMMQLNLKWGIFQKNDYDRNAITIEEYDLLYKAMYDPYTNLRLGSKHFFDVQINAMVELNNYRHLFQGSSEERSLNWWRIVYGCYNRGPDVADAMRTRYATNEEEASAIRNAERFVRNYQESIWENYL